MATSPTDTICVSVVYARADRQWAIDLALASGGTAADAFAASGLAALAPELAAAAPEFGLNHRRCDPAAVLRAGDRLEVLRPLLLDPIEARRLRAARNAGRSVKPLRGAAARREENPDA